MASSSNIQNYYPWPSTVNVANFISTKLWFDKTNLSTNYEIWKEQMLCLIEGQDLLGFIDGSILPPWPETDQENYRLWRRSDQLLKGWILGALGDHVHIVSQVAALGTARDLWLELENMSAQFKHALEPTGINLEKELIWLKIILQEQEQSNQMQGKDFNGYLPLYKDALQGNWEAAKSIFDRDPAAISAVVNPADNTPLSIALRTGKSFDFVKKMVDIMPDDAIAQIAFNGETVLHIAASLGNIGAATILVNRMPSLLYTPSFGRGIPMFPLQQAALYVQKPMVRYLISVTKEQAPYDGMSGLVLLLDLILVEFFDIASDLVIKYPYLAKQRFLSGVSALSLIAENKTVFSGGYRIGIWDRFIPKRRAILERQMMMNQQAQNLAKFLCSQLSCMTSMEALPISCDAILRAAQVDNSDLVEMIVEVYPDAINSNSTDSGRYMFHVAVENRSERVFNLVYQMSGVKLDYLNSGDKYGNTLLHEAGELAPTHKLNQISGAALQLQRELQWYKEVEKSVLPDIRNRVNNNNKSPGILFTEAHKELKEEGEKWMKDTSASCTIAAALIATVMFAAAITVPGGNESTTGFPMFSKDMGFIVFSISNAVSLFTSTTSLLMFLSILTSRYAEEDFLHALPKRLIIGLSMLFLSITFMMVAFSVTIYLVFGRKKAWVLIPVAALACLPVTSFVLLQYPLLFDLISSTYGRGIFGKQSNRPFY